MHNDDINFIGVENVAETARNVTRGISGVTGDEWSVARRGPKASTSYLLRRFSTADLDQGEWPISTTFDLINPGSQSKQAVRVDIDDNDANNIELALGSC